MAVYPLKYFNAAYPASKYILPCPSASIIMTTISSVTLSKFIDYPNVVNDKSQLLNVVAIVAKFSLI